MTITRSKERLKQYQEKVKSKWATCYERHPSKTVHQASIDGDIEKGNVELAKMEVPLFLWPNQKDCEDLHGKLTRKEIFDIVPTFPLNFYEHKPLERDLSDKVVLDYGCGSLARYTTEFAKIFKKVIAVDSSPFALNYCKKYTDQYDNIQLIETNGTDLQQVDSDSVDLVFSNLVFQHIGNKEVILQLLCEIFRVLNEGGIFRAMFWTEEKPDDHQCAYHGTGFSPEGYREVFEDVGFEVETITHDYPIIWITAIK